VLRIDSWALFLSELLLDIANNGRDSVGINMDHQFG